MYSFIYLSRAQLWPRKVLSQVEITVMQLERAGLLYFELFICFIRVDCVLLCLFFSSGISLVRLLCISLFTCLLACFICVGVWLCVLFCLFVCLFNVYVCLCHIFPLSGCHIEPGWLGVKNRLSIYLSHWARSTYMLGICLLYNFEFLYLVLSNCAKEGILRRTVQVTVCPSFA